MKTKHVFWGVLFISIGLLWLLDHFINFRYEWGELWRLWPIVIILLGVSVMVRNQLVKCVLSGFTAFILAFALFASVKYGLVYSGNGMEFSFDDNNHGLMSYHYGVTDYSEPFSSKYEKASLHFKAGAGSFIVQDTTRELFFAHTEGKQDNYTLTKEVSQNNVDLNFEMAQRHVSIFSGKNRNRVELKLNSDPSWDLDFDLGAASVNFDLSSYITEKVSINMGAASLKLKLGDRAEETRLDLNAGASSIDIEVPEDAACEIKTDVSLSSKHFEGFKSVDDDTYRTDNFNSAKKKIYISIDSGVSSIRVNRYTKSI
jgi:hypothetical protein